MKYTGYLYFWPIILFVPPAIYFLHEGLQYLLITGQTTAIISSNSECPALIFPIHNGQYIATTTAVANLQRLNISNYIQQLILIKLLPSPGHHIRAGFLILISRNWWEMRRWEAAARVDLAVRWQPGTSWGPGQGRRSHRQQISVWEEEREEVWEVRGLAIR